MKKKVGSMKAEGGSSEKIRNSASSSALPTSALKPRTSKAPALVPMTSPGAKKGAKLTRSGSASGQPGQIVTFANKWRENYNPFRAFAIRKAVELIEAGQRGDYALLQWTYRRLERAYPTLSGLISRCEAPLLNFRWDIKIKSQLPKGFSEADAEAQQHSLRTAYEAVDNLTAAIRHLHMAEFREYAHLQKHRSGDGEVYHLETLDQWMICRDGIYGDWFWNPDSKFTSTPAMALGESNRIGGDALPIEDFIIRTVPRPINEIAMVVFARWALVQKNWDAFIEIYGVPGGVIEMPQNVPPDKETQYEDSAKAIAEGGVGAIPNGSKYYPNAGPRGTDPFSPRVKTLDEDLVLAGTGGKMSMLNAATGLGGGSQSKTHDEVFQEIAQSRAMAISETFQRSFDAEVLEREHPGEPWLAYFELSPDDDVDVDGLIANVVSLAGAGWKTDESWLKEQTGYELEEKEEVVQEVGSGKAEVGSGKKIQNARASLPNSDIILPTSTGIANRLQELSTASDEEFAEKFAAFNRDFPQVGRILNGGKGSGRYPKGSGRGRIHDAFGPRIDESQGGLSEKENIQRGVASADYARRKQRDVRDAMYRKEIGRIDFLWGTPGDASKEYEGGKGLAHILAKHGEADLRKLPIVLAKGKFSEHPKGDPKRLVTYGSYTVSLVKSKNRQAWVLTGFSKGRQVSR